MAKYRRRTLLTMAGTGLAALSGCSSDKSTSDQRNPTQTTSTETGSNSSGLPASGEWPMRAATGGRTEYMSSFSGPSPPLTQSWRAGNFTGKNLAGGGMVLNYDSSANYGGITAMDITSGETQWTTSNDAESNSIGGPLRIVADKVFTSNAVVKLADGTPVWGPKKDFHGTVADETGIYGRPSLTNTSSVIKLDPDSGERLWEASFSYARPTYMNNVDGTVICDATVNGKSGLVGIDRATGSKKWSLQIDNNPIAVKGNILYLYDDQPALIAQDIDSGEVLWTSANPAWGRNLAVSSRQVFATTPDNRLVARSAQNGEIQWTIDLGLERVNRLFGAGSQLYATGSLGRSEGKLTGGTVVTTTEGANKTTVQGLIAELATENRVIGSNINGQTPKIICYISK